MTQDTLNWLTLAIFVVAVLHTFSVKQFEKLAHKYPKHHHTFHFLGEVEAVFGIWAAVLLITLFAARGGEATVAYVNRLNFTEPLFVFAIMVVAASKPIVSMVQGLVQFLAGQPSSLYNHKLLFLTLFLTPMLGSLITEPAAMTLAAFMLKKYFFTQDISNRFKYMIVGVLFVNVSVGGTLTPFAAPPVLMVAAKWGWDLHFMLTTFGWHATLICLVNAASLVFIQRTELSQLYAQQQAQVHTLSAGLSEQGAHQSPVPWLLCAIHSAFLLGVVLLAHHPVLFIGLVLFFMAFVEAYPEHQNKLFVRESLMVAFFLAGLVVLGGLQAWWLQPLISGLTPTELYFGATALTAITDNAALTYLGSLVEGLSDEAKYLLVAGAVTGGGLTVIANAPNPAGYTILKGHFHEQEISPLGLFMAALPPTIVAILVFKCL